jgi:catechol 2,3-dioxygenase
MTDVPSLEAHKAPLHVSHVELIVRDLTFVETYYIETLGFAVVARGDGFVGLGVDGVELLRLQHHPNATLRHRRATGLFHTAFLLPNRAKLGAWLKSAIERRVEFDGASDHGVSDALYLTDPEGNGVEIYADRPRETWHTADGTIPLITEPMDVKAVLAAGATLPAAQALPSGTRIGHIHLSVGDIRTAEPFFREGLGLDLIAQRDAARFMSTGGYHHHIAINTWMSAGSGRRVDGTTGLSAYTLQSTDSTDAERRIARLSKLGATFSRRDRDVTVSDPNGVAMTIKLPVV